MDTVKRISRRCARVCLLAAIVLIFNWTLIPQSRAQVVQAAQGDRRPLAPAEDRQVFDGAVSQNIVFHGKNRIFHYTPPTGWQTNLSGNRVNFTKNGVTTTLLITASDYETNAAPANPTEIQLKNFDDETLAKISSNGSATRLPVALLPFKVGNQNVAVSTVSYERSGKRHMLQRVKSWGANWQVELELTGPEKEFLAVSPSFLQSLCSIDSRTNDDRQNEAALQEKQVLAALGTPAPANHTAAESVGKVRGKVP